MGHAVWLDLIICTGVPHHTARCLLLAALSVAMLPLCVAGAYGVPLDTAWSPSLLPLLERGFMVRGPASVFSIVRPSKF